MKAKYRIENKTTLVLVEDAKKDDIIDLSEKIDIDSSNVDSLINDAIERNNQKKINDAINEEKKRNLKEKEDEKKALKAEIELQYAKKIAELNGKITEYENSKTQLVEQNKTNIENVKLSLENTYKDQINALTGKIKEIENESLRKIEAKEKEKQEKIQELTFDLRRAKEELDNEINRKKTLSVKEIGEDLEQFCENRVNKVLSYGGFPNATFEKDNTCIEGDDGKGKKGDFIFKDHNDEGIEFVSIMFEMKNEDPDSKNKHKNKDFFEKLDKDRQRKNCRFAVLVSLLEPDNELYNEGIVVVKEYENMYVIRPQFIVPFISFIRTNCLNNISYLKEINDYKQSNIDVENFNKELGDFKASFGNNVRLAVERFDKAIGDIDNTIRNLEKTKEDLTASKRNLMIANGKVDDVTIRKLTKNSPSLKEKFKELEKNNKDL